MERIVKKYLNVINHNEVGKGKLYNIERTSMGDDTIRSYLPNAKILSYPDLATVAKIEDLLPQDKSYFCLLYLQQPNSGHWVLVYRDRDVINFFCSYGSMPNTPLGWISKEQNEALGQGTPYLMNLFNASPLPVDVNKIDYQSNRNMDIATCGRHDVFRLHTFLHDHLDMKEYYTLMKHLKENSRMSYDEIVSDIINKI